MEFTQLAKRYLQHPGNARLVRLWIGVCARREPIRSWFHPIIERHFASKIPERQIRRPGECGIVGIFHLNDCCTIWDRIGGFSELEYQAVRYRLSFYFDIIPSSVDYRAVFPYPSFQENGSFFYIAGRQDDDFSVPLSSTRYYELDACYPA
jgi:hypothetical protein